MKLASVLTPLSDENLTLAAQCGVEQIVLRYPGPDPEALATLQRRVHSFGMTVGAIEGYLPIERIKLGLILHDPEEEHDCFSDKTHNSHYYDELGMKAIWTGSYTRTDGRVVKGASLAELAAAKAPEAKAKLDQAFADALAKMTVIENMRLAKMATDRTWLSCTMILALRERGGSGSPIRPVAYGAPQ